MPRLHKNTFECVVLPFWVDIDTELETVVVNTLEYVIEDGEYARNQHFFLSSYIFILQLEGLLKRKEWILAML